MKKISLAFIVGLLLAIAAPAFAAASKDANTCPVESCWSNNAACNNGAYCQGDRSACYDSQAYCGGNGQRGHYRGGCSDNGGCW